MHPRRVISLLGLAGLTLLHGCADSSAPPKATGGSGKRATSGAAVVTATHYESMRAENFLLDEAVFAPLLSAQQRPSHVRRLPPVHLAAGPARSIDSAPASQPRFERLPSLGHVSPNQSRTHAIDLTERDEPALTPPVIEGVTEKEEARQPVVPVRRIVPAEAPKPPLPPLTKLAAAAPSGSAGWLMTGTSLVALSQRADGMIDRGFVLAEKGAYYSAQTEFKQALRTVSQAMDAHFGGSDYSEALAAGWLALEEADDFAAHSHRGPVVDVGLIVQGHQTPLLKDYALRDVSPVLAMQHYFVFAQEQLVKACGRAPVASRALHGMGKVHMVLGEKSGSAERLHGPKAMAFQQAALSTDPGNYLAANELGVLLARFGKLQEARSVLQHAVAMNPLPETWQNLTVVHQRLGETQLAAQSHANWQVASQHMGGQLASQQVDNRSTVQWVPPQAFAEQHPGSPYSSPVPMPAAQPQPPPQQAKQKSGFFWW